MTTTTTPTEEKTTPLDPNLFTTPEPIMPKEGEKTSFKSLFGLQSPFIAQKGKVQKAISEAEGEEAKAKQAQAETLAGEKAKVQEEYGAAEKQAMDRYKERTEAEPIPAFVPTKDNAQDLATLFSAINVIGMLLGGGGRTNAVNALAAMDGMAKGYQQGRTDLYRKERDTFEKNYRAMLQKHAEFRKDMEDAIKLAATNKEAGMAKAELAAAKAGSSIVQAGLRKGELLSQYKNIDDAQKGVSTTYDLFTKEKAREENEKLRYATLAQTKQLAMLKAGAKTGGLGSGAFLESVLGVKAGDEKTNQKIVDTATGVSQLNHVINLFRDPEVRTGVLSKLNPIREKLSSLGDDNHEINDAELQSIIDGEISPNAKNAVAQKEALFAAYTAEREIAGGRLLVSVVKQAGGALDPSNYEKSGYINLLNSRENELKKRLRGEKMSDEQIDKVVSALDQSAPKQPTSVTATTKSMPEQDKLKTYADSYFGGDVTKAKEYLASQGYK